MHTCTSKAKPRQNNLSTQPFVRKKEHKLIMWSLSLNETKKKNVNNKFDAAGVKRLIKVSRET